MVNIIIIIIKYNIFKVLLLIIKKVNSFNKWISKCPANKLADIRTLKVIGRIIILISSIKTIKGLIE